MNTVHATVNHIFAMCPELCGFSVQDAETLTRDRVSGQLEAGLYLADVATTTNGTKTPRPRTRCAAAPSRARSTEG
jgi:hypothetical protein